MQRSTLFCVVSMFAMCMAAGSAAADSEPRDITTLEPDYTTLVPIDMPRARAASTTVTPARIPFVPAGMNGAGAAMTTPAAIGTVHYVAESPATATRANYVGESPARATTAYYLTSSPPKSRAVSPASLSPITPITTSKPAYLTQSPVTNDGCACSPPVLPSSYAATTPVVTGSTQIQPVVTTTGNPWAVVSAARPVGDPCSPCSSVTSLCSPANCTTGVPVVAYRPVVATPPLPPRHRFGKGMIGQPVVYVSGQPIRNALRWFFP